MKLKKGLSGFFAVPVLICFYADLSFGQETEVLTLKPSKCVALRKGQTCYQRIKIQFVIDKPGDYCLRIDNKKEPLQCWTKTRKGNLFYNLVSSENRLFTLQTESREIAQSQVTIAWVYQNKSRRRSSWRLF